jgi:2-dehydro-3-deoxyglucarate aldolase/4-hydroxy-2-oxoheptanedioate aldolase
VKQKLKDGKVTSGAFLQLNCNIAAEIMSLSGFDWLMIDMEHAPVDHSSLLSQIQAIECASNCIPFARVPGNDPLFIKRTLDAGVKGILIPNIDNAEQAKKAVSYCLFPPMGTRGAALSPRAAKFGVETGSFFEQTNTNMITMVSVESTEALDNLDEILMVNNLDGIFIGPMDLAMSMGYNDVNCKEVKQAISEIENKVKKSDKFLATVATNWDVAKSKYALGYQSLILMQDSLALSAMANKIAVQFSEMLNQNKT